MSFFLNNKLKWIVYLYVDSTRILYSSFFTRLMSILLHHHQHQHHHHHHHHQYHEHHQHHYHHHHLHHHHYHHYQHHHHQQHSTGYQSMGRYGQTKDSPHTGSSCRAIQSLWDGGVGNYRTWGPKVALGFKSILSLHWISCKYDPGSERWVPPLNWIFFVFCPQWSLHVCF